MEMRFPLSLALYGAYDSRGMDLHGVSVTYGQPAAAGIASEEYSHPAGLNLNWLFGGEASVGLFSLEIQKNLSQRYASCPVARAEAGSGDVVYSCKKHADFY